MCIFRGSLFVVCCVLVVSCSSLFVVCWLVFDDRCWLLVGYCLLGVWFWVLFVDGCCLLFVVRCLVGGVNCLTVVVC